MSLDAALLQLKSAADPGPDPDDLVATLLEGAPPGRLANGHAGAGPSSSSLFERGGVVPVPGTLHCVVWALDRDGTVRGLTYRLGRHLPGGG